MLKALGKGAPRPFLDLLRSNPDATARPAPPRSCLACGAVQVNFVRCSRCQTAIFCNRRCQMAAWPAHKKECEPPHKVAAAAAGGGGVNAVRRAR